MSENWDVIVVGGGPGGAAAAKRCAERGLKTLLLEKSRLPREKVCSGMIITRASRELINEEFGEIPGEVLSTPPYLSGYMQHVGPVTQIIENRMPHAWRKDLDYWMDTKARDKGAVLLDAAPVRHVSERDGKYVVTVEGKEGSQELEARFLIGADGATSVVRKSLFPECRMDYLQNYRECYEAAGINLDPNYTHQFYDIQRPPYRSGVMFYGDLCTAVVAVKLGHLKEAREQLKTFAHQYNLGIFAAEPLWKDGCIAPLSQKDVISGKFLPARGNVMLVGEAAGLGFPILWEGIGLAIRNGIAAANAIVQVRRGGSADKYFLDEMEAPLGVLRGAHAWIARIRESGKGGPQRLAEALKAAFEGLVSTPRW